MKSRTLLYCLAVCLALAIVLTAPSKAPSTAAPSPHPTPDLAKLGQPRSSIEPVAPMAATSLWNASLLVSSLLADDSNGGVVFQQDHPYNPALPTAEELILTPPANAGKTILSVRFGELAAEKLDASIPMLLSKQHVVLQRSADDPSVFSAPIDFDWHAFAREQQQRKDAAENGWMVPRFDGRHFVGKERMEFVDPIDIEAALQNHQPLRFSRHVFDGAPETVLPNKELMVTDIPVVTDPIRTWDPCNPGTGTPNGAWTFKTLMKAIRNGDNSGSTIAVNAEIMLDQFLATWQNSQTINTFSVPSRPNINGFLANWPIDSTGHHSLDQAPVRLNAIVNRIDLGQAPNSPTPAGELRFIFGVTAGTGQNQFCSSNQNQLFNIILEYNVPSSIDANTWANEWNALANLSENDSAAGYMAALQAMTDQVVTANKCPSCPNGSSLAQLRTNEIELGTIWEQRQFHLAISVVPSNLVETTVSQTPEGSFTGFSGGPFGAPPCTGNPNGCASNQATVTNFILQNFLQIENGSYIVPTTFQGQPFLGGSVFNGGPPADGFWNGNPSIPQVQDSGRVILSENTCNGCHGREVRTDGFQQVVNNRTTTTASGLTGFLLGCTDSTTCQPGAPNQCSLDTPNLACVETVTDPVFSNLNNQFGDLARRVTVLQGLITNGPNSGSMLLPFNRPTISFVH